jgi:hypothetical protein
LPTVLPSHASRRQDSLGLLLADSCLFQLEGSHVPYITSPQELAPMLLELAAR